MFQHKKLDIRQHYQHKKLDSPYIILQEIIHNGLFYLMLLRMLQHLLWIWTAGNQISFPFLSTKYLVTQLDLVSTYTNIHTVAI